MKIAPLLAAIALLGCSGAASSPSPSVSEAATPSASPAVTSTLSPTSTPAASAALPPLIEGPLTAEVEASLQEVLDVYVHEHQLVPSMSVAVIVPGVGTWRGATGWADIEGGVAATPESIYAVGSVTKTFVAALILRLAEEGFLDLDDPAADHLGPVAGSKANGATVRQLLGMRSGIANYTDHAGIFTEGPWSPASVLDIVGEPHFAPGEEFEFSNTNYLLLGLIAEVVTGGPLGDLLHEYLLWPHDLTRTYYSAAEPADEPVAHGYAGGRNELRDIYDGSGRLPNANIASAALGAGAVASTATDVARWVHALYSGDVVSAASQGQMLDFGDSVEYGLGVERFVLPSAGQVIGHTGSHTGFGYSTAGCIAPASGVIVAMLSNGERLDIDGALNGLFRAAGRALQ
jgi:D-alanyl-D-alanine carboxypeptidase